MSPLKLCICTLTEAIFIKIKHIKQNLNDNTCGAVCLRMIFNYRKIKGSIDHIYDNISDDETFGIRLCKNILILRYLMRRGFQCCVVSVNNLEKVLDIASKNKINVIFNMRPDINSDGGHYVLFLRRINKFVCVNDPAKARGNTLMSITKLKKCLTPVEFSPIVEKNTLVLVNTYTQKLETINFKCSIDGNANIECFKCISRYVKKIICPKHDHFNSIMIIN